MKTQSDSIPVPQESDMTTNQDQKPTLESIHGNEKLIHVCTIYIVARTN